MGLINIERNLVQLVVISLSDLENAIRKAVELGADLALRTLSRVLLRCDLRLSF